MNKYNFKILNSGDYRITINGTAKKEILKTALTKAIQGYNMFGNKVKAKDDLVPDYFEVPKNLFPLVNMYLKNEIKKIIRFQEQEIKKQTNKQIQVLFPYLKEGTYKKENGNWEMTIIYEGIYLQK